jgi:phage major head subunit gpT-like protein
MREWGQGRLARGLRNESYSLENLKYESTLEVDRDELADDQTGQIRVRVAELAERAASHKDYLIAQLLMSGHQAGFHSYDGVPFFSSNHVSGASGAQSNEVQSGASTPATPQAHEFRQGMILAISKMLGLKDDQGEPMSFTADGLVAIVPPGMYFGALEAMSASLLNNTSNVLEGIARVIAFPWLAGDVWYLLKTNASIRPFIFQDREPIEFTALGDDSEESFRREKLLFGVRARYRIAYGYWQYAVRASFVEA